MIKYDSHDKEWGKVIENEERKLIGETWKKTNTLDSLAHDKQRKIFLEILGHYKNASLLTIGDGRYGNDGIFFINNGYKTHVSDYSDKLLKIAYEENLIQDYSSQNAENISFADSTFDFIFVKEALHHCPRPNLAISEMLRCAKKGVLISEPRDLFINNNFLFKLVLTLYKILKGKNFPKHNHEKVGNYVYSLSQREIEKTALGLHFNIVAFKKINTTYIKGSELIDLNTKKFSQKCIIKFWKLKVLFFDILCKLGIMESLVISAVIFKEDPGNIVRKSMIKKGWVFSDLPKNPYL